MKKTFDCVAMKHEIHARIYEETKLMTTTELTEYYRRGAEAFRAEAASRPKQSLAELLAELDRKQEKGETSGEL